MMYKGSDREGETIHDKEPPDIKVSGRPKVTLKHWIFEKIEFFWDKEQIKDGRWICWYQCVTNVPFDRGWKQKQITDFLESELNRYRAETAQIDLVIDSLGFKELVYYRGKWTTR